MPRFVVLLRGVNVGKANRVPMAGFKQLLEGLGYTQVRTLLNSGNAVFDSSGRSAAKHAAAIGAALLATFGVDTPVVVKSAAELDAIVSGNPFEVPEDQHSRFLVGFGGGSSGLAAFAPLQSQLLAGERFAVGADALYLHCAQGLLESRIGATLLGKPGKAVTTRNWATVLKLANLTRTQ